MRSLNEVTGEVIGAAVKVHRALGPGLLEAAYETCLAYELGQRGLKFERQKAIPLVYHQVELDCGYRLDLLVEDEVVVEVKAVEGLLAIHTAQVLSYLKLSGLPVGLLINFNTRVLKDGLRRLVNNYPEGEPYRRDRGER